MAEKFPKKPMVLDGETLRPKSTLPKTAPGDEHSAVPIRAILSFSGRADQAVKTKPSGRSNAEYTPKGTALGWKGKRKVYGEGKRRMEEKHEIRVGTWNVRTMNAMGKLENVKEEMQRNRLSIMDVSEVRWKDGGDFVSNGYRVMYAGGPTCQRGVADITEAKVAERVTEIDRFGDRIMEVKVNANPVDMVIVQAYLPTTDYEDEEVEKLYDQLEEILGKQKGTDNVIVMGDFNAAVGEGKEDRVVGKYGLGKRNDKGESLIEFCKSQNLVITNTWFEQEKRRRYTWKSPGDLRRYQIDYILVQQRYRNSVKSSWSYPGADVDSDHNLMAVRLKLKLKKIPRRKQQKKWNLDSLVTKVELFRKI